MKGLLKKIAESDYFKFSLTAIYCLVISCFFSYLTCYFYLTKTTKDISTLPGKKRTVLNNDPKVELVSLLKNIEETNSHKALKEDLQKYTAKDPDNFYPFLASLKYYLGKSTTLKKRTNLRVTNLSLIRESFKTYENYFEKNKFNDHRTFEHKTELSSYSDNYHTQGLKNQYLHHIYLEHKGYLSRFFNLYLSVDVADEKTFERRLEKVLKTLQNLFHSESFYAVRHGSYLYSRLYGIIETSPHSKYEVFKSFQKIIDDVDSQLYYLKGNPYMRKFYRNIFYENANLNDVLNFNFNTKISTHAGASFVNILFNTLTPIFILIILSYALLAMYRWKLSNNNVLDKIQFLSRKDYTNALLFSTLFILIGFFVIPSLNYSHQSFLYLTSVLQIIFINLIYFIPLFWLRTKLLVKFSPDERNPLEINNIFKLMLIKVILYILCFTTAYLIGIEDIILSLAPIIFLFEITFLVIFFGIYIFSLKEGNLSKWSLSHLKLVLNFTSLNVLTLVSINMFLWPLVQKHFIVNDPLFHYEIKNGQIQAKAYSVFMDDLKSIRKSGYEIVEQTRKSGSSYIVEIAPEAE